MVTSFYIFVSPHFNYLIKISKRGIIVILRFADQTQLLDFCCHTTTDQQTPSSFFWVSRSDTDYVTAIRKYWSLLKVRRKVNYIYRSPSQVNLLPMNVWVTLISSSDIFTPLVLPLKLKPRHEWWRVAYTFGSKQK